MYQCFGLAVVDPVFLAVRVGDAVLVQPGGDDWWVGQVIHREGGARCNGNSFFQIACVDTGVIRTVNPNWVTGVVQRSGGTYGYKVAGAS
jgi:hypothetical protein